MNVLGLDLETRSRTPIDDGSYKYAETAEILLASLGWEDSQVEVAEWDDVAIPDLRAAIHHADRVVVHNSEFDFVILEQHHIHVPMHKRYCTMAQARRHGLPSGLDKLCEIFRLPQDKAKMKAGRALMLLFCTPRPDGSWATKDTHPVEWLQFKEYARLDVVAMMELHRIMPTWNDELERPNWELDARVNARGFKVDTQFAWMATQLLADDKGELNDRMKIASDGYVEKGTQRDRLLAHLLAEHGVSLPDLTASTLDRRLKDPDLPDAVRELIALRQQSSKTSNSKYATLLRCVNSDERLRGSLTYCGAHRTKRWTGNKFQPHNLPRATMSPEEIEHGVRCIKVNAVSIAGNEPLPRYASEGLRGVVVPAPGHKLLVADLANIEGRVVAWLAGEQWKLDAFRSYDAGTGPDLYKLSYARAFAVEPDTVTGQPRQIGKVKELMLGYGGGVGAFITGAETYKVDLEAMAPLAWPNIPRDLQIEAELWWAKSEQDGKTFGLSHDVFVTCDGLKRVHRRDNPKTEQFWYDMEDAAKRTTATGESTEVGEFISFDKEGAWLRMCLPNGGYLCYPSPRISNAGELTFMGSSPYSRKWQRQKTWGGTLVENACQAIARDVLCAGMVEAENLTHAFDIVLHVHDEAIVEAPLNANVEELCGCLTKGWDWTVGLPLAAKGFETLRYRKAD